MMKIKQLLLIACTAVCFTACKNEPKFDSAAQFNADTTAIRAFVTANKIPATKAPSGVFYQILAPGTGSVSYNANTQVSANYEGKLLNGTIFDKTVDKPFSFVLGGNIIQGWKMAIPLVQPGGQVRFILPSLYGYGHQSVGPVPADAVLDFTVTVVSATNPTN